MRGAAHGQAVALGRAEPARRDGDEQRSVRSVEVGVACRPLVRLLFFRVQSICGWLRIFSGSSFPLLLFAPADTHAHSLSVRSTLTTVLPVRHRAPCTPRRTAAILHRELPTFSISRGARSSSLLDRLGPSLGYVLEFWSLPCTCSDTGSTRRLPHSFSPTVEPGRASHYGSQTRVI